MYNQVINERFHDIGISLTSIGIHEIAFSFNSVLQIINWCKDNDCIILGGDVYKICNNVISSTEDSWYYNPQEGLDNVLLSMEKAKSYIKNYDNRNGKNFIYSVVVCEKNEFLENMKLNRQEGE